MTYKHEDYDWHDPRGVLVVNNSEYDTVAYGVPKAKSTPTPEPKVIPKGDSFYEDPLPKPKHGDTGIGADRCLACEWISLKARIQEQSNG